MTQPLVKAAIKAAFSAGMIWGISAGLLQSVSAHSVDVTADVAGTWHIEPDHQPKAGESSQVWIALTRQGGELLPFEQTACSLGVYDMPRSPSDAPILSPSLQPISAEQYQNIPGADVVFPDTGLYQLELACQPAAGAAEFTPFKMQYDVTVASAAAPASSATNPVESPISPVAPTPVAPTSPAASPAVPALDSSPSAPWVQAVGLGFGAIATLILLGLIARLFRGKG